MNRKGHLLWEKNYGGAGNDVAYCAKQTADGGFVIAGWSESSGSGRDIYLLKVDRAGNLEWEKTYGGDGSSAASALLLTAEGEYIVAGWREQQKIEKQACIMSISESGDQLWERTYGDTAGFFNGIDHASNGGFIMAGGIENEEGFDGYIVRIDENGEVEGELVIDRSSHDVLNAVCRADDGGFILAGESISPLTGDMDTFVVKIDGFNNIEWELSLGVDGDSWGNAIIDAGDIYVVAGEGAYRGTQDVVAYVAGIDYTGREQWVQPPGKGAGGCGK